MNKKLIVIAFILISTFSFSQQTKTKWSGVIRNITQSTPGTFTLVTPPVTGQYRLSIYNQIVQNDAGYDNPWTFTYTWYDGIGNENINFNLLSSSVPPNAYAQQVITFTTAKQTPIMYTITKIGTDKAIAEVSWVLELLVQRSTL